MASTHRGRRFLPVVVGIIGWSAFAAAGANAFIHDMFQPTARPHNDLSEITNHQEGDTFAIRLDIHNDEEWDRHASVLAINNMIFELHKDHALDAHPNMPGADGKHPQISSGARKLELLQAGSYVSLLGLQTVPAEHACWEICWMKDKPAGTLICGFDVPRDFERNGAVLHQGSVFLSFPIWSKKGLEYGRQEKQKLEELCDQCLHRRDEELSKFESTENPLLKALHLHLAFAAVEEYDNLEHRTMASIPEDNEVLALPDDLLLMTKGMIWSKRPEGGDKMLGWAYLSQPKKRGNNKLMP